MHSYIVGSREGDGIRVLYVIACHHVPTICMILITGYVKSTEEVSFSYRSIKWKGLSCFKIVNTINTLRLLCAIRLLCATCARYLHMYMYKYKYKYHIKPLYFEAQLIRIPVLFDFFVHFLMV